MDHSTHKPGTMRGCKECSKDAYEPGWYAAMLSITNNGNVVVDLSGARRPAESFTTAR
jgi:hypothetical protein